MAEEPTQDNLERSEEATPKRRESARAKGQFPRSRYLIPAATLAAIAVTLRFGGEELMARMQRCLIGFIGAAGKTQQLAADDLIDLAVQSGFLFAPVLAPIFGATLFAALGTGFMQSGFVMASEPIRWDFSRINPLTGWRRLFSVETFSESVKAVILIGGLGLLGVLNIYSYLPAIVSLSGFRPDDIAAFGNHHGANLIAWVVGVTGALAGLDFIYQYWRTSVQLRMSRQEVKEEMREQEGDPQVKGYLRSLRQKMSKRRMSAEVAKADVIITNPTHLAVALGYRAGEMTAPRLLGKGAGFIAERIREIAREKSIPIIENKTLARLLYQKVEVGREIPEALYRAVAEVLAYVYGLRRRSGATAKPAAPRAQD